ncbi:hypothetical protein TNCV_4656881 [Trichonephila clavipes]|nr:hypothetical protein TNCV_4656881 [Trichonephila clavipes]
MSEAEGSARRVAHQVGRSDLTVRRCWDHDIYTDTRLRTPSIDQSLRRPSHHTTRVRRAKCLIGRCPDTGSTFTTSPCLPEPSQGTWLMDVSYPGVHYMGCQ